MSRADETTRRPADAEGAGTDRPVPALTILAHPEHQRIGEISLLHHLMSRPQDLSRLRPDFAPPGDPWKQRPLEDPYLSRTPHQLRWVDGDRVVLRRQPGGSELRVDGEVLVQGAEIAVRRLDPGVLIELGRRIALWLHRLPRDAETRPRSSDLGMVGASPSLESVRDSIRRVAPLDLPVLLRGESGTGKELAARALHQNSSRSKQPFLAINLGALSPGLAAAELFGNVRGAFTGADVARDGYFRAAEGGTLFLDEVGEAPPEVQVMLLRALETGEIVPVGSHNPRRVDVRLVAATDSDLEGRARRGQFKEPLIHRLASYEIQLPPLRQRLDDLGRLTKHFAEETYSRLGEPAFVATDDSSPWLPPALVRQLAQRSWHGNVRELRNLVRRLVVDHPKGSLPESLDSLRIDDWKPTEDQTEDEGEAGASGEGPRRQEAEVAPRRPSDIAASELESAWSDCDYQPAAAARRLGISRASIYNLIRDHPTFRTAEDLDDDEIQQALGACGDDVAAAASLLKVSYRALARRVARQGRGS